VPRTDPGFWTDTPKDPAALLAGERGTRRFVETPEWDPRDAPGPRYRHKPPDAARFRDRFERHVGPQLATLARVQGTFVACEMVGYSGAYSALLYHAHKRGAAFLPDDAYERLQDWAHTALLAEVERADRIRAVAERGIP
jgi:hypothetical protein